MDKMSFLPRLIRLDFKVFDKMRKAPPLRCVIFGHSLYASTNIAGEHPCRRFGCDYKSPAVQWKRTVPTMPKCKPPRKEEKNLTM